MKAFNCDVAMLRPLLHELPLSSAAGIDKISAEYPNLADPCIAMCLSLYFNMCLMHGFIPSNFLDTIINPIFLKIVIKVCMTLLIIANCACHSNLKQFEHVILAHIAPMCMFGDHQFGFKTNCNTDMCVCFSKTSELCL